VLTPDQLLLKEHILNTWTNNHKKSAIGVLILLVINRESTWSGHLQREVEHLTDGYLTIDQPSLLRLLRRLEQLDLITASRCPGLRGGAHRKMFRITHYGQHVLRDYCGSTLRYLDSRDFLQMVRHASGPLGDLDGCCRHNERP
jgi:DNA-binding PadR family transcriptional regulator